MRGTKLTAPHGRVNEMHKAHLEGRRALLLRRLCHASGVAAGLEGGKDGDTATIHADMAELKAINKVLDKPQ